MDQQKSFLLLTLNYNRNRKVNRPPLPVHHRLKPNRTHRSPFMIVWFNKETPDSTSSSVPSEPKAATRSETVPTQEGKGAGEGTGYTVQVGSFQSLDYAEGIVESLKKKGYSPSLATVSLPNGKTWHRVRIGNCNSREEAEILVQKLKEGGNFEPMIISPEKGKEDSHKTLNNSLDSAAAQSPPLPPQGLPEGAAPKP